MLKELFDAINQRAQAAMAPNFVDWNPHKAHAYRRPDGSVATIDAEPAVRKHRLASIDDLAQFAKDHSQDGGVFFYDAEQITFFLDDAARTHSAYIELDFSDPWRELNNLAGKNGRVSQQELIWSLRTTFKGCLPDKTILEAVRNCRFDQEAKKESELQRGRSSIGTAILTKFAGLAELPEYVTFNCPVWKGAVQFNVPVECVLDPDEKNGSFILAPLPGALTAATVLAEQELGRRLTIALGEDFMLYNGVP